MIGTRVFIFGVISMMIFTIGYCAGGLSYFSLIKRYRKSMGLDPDPFSLLHLYNVTKVVRDIRQWISTNHSHHIDSNENSKRKKKMMPCFDHEWPYINSQELDKFIIKYFHVSERATRPR